MSRADERNRWTVLRDIDKLRCEARCECGTIKIVYKGNIRNGYSKSCGCLRDELALGRIITHGRGGTKNGRRDPTYRTWVSMLHRGRYGSRNAGPPVGVCERWFLFENFFSDMGEKPGPGFSIDRIDNAKGYEPNNCRWATWTQQARNRRNTRFVTIDGETRSVAEWAEFSPVAKQTIIGRLNDGWDPRDAVFASPVPHKDRRSGGEPIPVPEWAIRVLRKVCAGGDHACLA